MIRVLVALLLLASLEASADPSAQPLNVEGCVKVGLTNSGQLMQAQGAVDEWRGKLREIRYQYAPHLFGTFSVAPMYGVHGNGFDPQYTVDLQEWGPYLHLDATLVQPVYTFGLIEQGRKATEERLAVELARFQQTRNTVSQTVRRNYYQYLYARSLKPTLNQAKRTLDDALHQANEQYESGSGQVTAVDLNKLRSVSTDLQKAIIQQQTGERLALAALKQSMGLALDAPLVLTEQMLPPAPKEAVPELSALLQIASANRPELSQLTHGAAAAAAGEQAQRMANRPALFLGGEFGADYSPTRDRDNSPWHVNPFNGGISGGGALGLRFDVDLTVSRAKGDTAHGLVEQVEGFHRIAQTGIPLEIRKARLDLIQARDLLDIAQEGATAAKKWMMFAATAYSAGTGEAREVLQGVGAYVQARKGYFDALLALYQARIDLQYVIGDPAPKSKQ